MNINTIVETLESYVIIKELKIYKIRIITEVLFMTATWEKKEGNQGLLTVTVPKEEVDKGLDKAFKKLLNKLMYLVSVKVKCQDHYLNKDLVLNHYTKML